MIFFSLLLRCFFVVSLDSLQAKAVFVFFFFAVCTVSVAFRSFKFNSLLEPRVYFLRCSPLPIQLHAAFGQSFFCTRTATAFDQKILVHKRNTYCLKYSYEFLVVLLNELSFCVRFQENLCKDRRANVKWLWLKQDEQKSNTMRRRSSSEVNFTWQRFWANRPTKCRSMRAVSSAMEMDLAEDEITEWKFSLFQLWHAVCVCVIVCPAGSIELFCVSVGESSRWMTLQHFRMAFSLFDSSLGNIHLTFNRMLIQ